MGCIFIGSPKTICSQMLKYGKNMVRDDLWPAHKSCDHFNLSNQKRTVSIDIKKGKIMFKQSLFAIAMVIAPSIASAVTVTAINGTGGSDLTQSLVLPGAFTAAPLTVTPPPADSNSVFLSPFGTNSNTPYYSVGLVTDNPNSIVYDGTANPAVLALSSLSRSISLIWGSPDTYNALNLYNAGALVASIVPGAVAGLPADRTLTHFVTITADSILEYFDSVEFVSTGVNAFEFANVSATPVPLPAGVLLMGTALAGFGVMRRRQNKKSA